MHRSGDTADVTLDISKDSSQSLQSCPQEEIMRLRLAGSLSLVPGVIGLLVLPQQLVVAQYSQPSLTNRYEAGWENDLVRVRTISVEPGAQMSAQADTDRVLVFLTADFNGRMPAAEAIWQSAGTRELQNRGNLRVDAVVIELKNAPANAVGVTPPEALPSTEGVDARVLIDNPRVLVTRLRYALDAYATGPWHFHPQDAVMVYLRGGYTWLPQGGWGSQHVRRGDMDVVPANTFHILSNPGGNPLEFLMIFPK
jgi:quercetin dioxygenase-like cupin family protein